LYDIAYSIYDIVNESLLIAIYIIDIF